MMSITGEQRERVVAVGLRSAIGIAISLFALIAAIAAHANVEAPNSAAYQEVTVPLDPETRAVGGALYAQHVTRGND